jgi:hypothetical protein
MKKLLFALVVGAALGFAASAGTSQPDASASPNCGPLTCTAKQECCVSPHPFTYRCVTPGHCPYNN